MTDLNHSEDEVARYVMGGMSKAQQREFESRLAQSAELCALVRDVEDGVVALAMTAPQLPLPAQSWRQIAGAIHRRKQGGPWFALIFQNGWGLPAGLVAAACVFGWLLHVAWIDHVAGGKEPVTLAAQSAPLPPPVSHPATSGLVATPTVENPAARNQPSDLEIIRLRAQVGELRNCVDVLAQTVARQKGQLAESSRFKFCHLSAAAGNNGGAPAPLSPALRQALFLAVARELGWLPPSAFAADNPPANAGQTGIDFVDLRNGTNGVVTTALFPADPDSSPDAASLGASEPANATIGFVSGSNLVVVIHPGMVPGNTPVNVTSVSGNHSQLLGTVSMNNMTVLMTYLPSDGLPASLELSNSSGFTNSLLIDTSSDSSASSFPSGPQ